MTDSLPQDETAAVVETVAGAAGAAGAVGTAVAGMLGGWSQEEE